MKLHMLKSVATAALLLGTAGALASPSLIGDTVTYDNASADSPLSITASPIAFVVGVGGPELGICVDGSTTNGCSSTGLSIGIDVEATSISFTFTGSTGDGGAFRFDLTDLDFTPAGTLVGITPAFGGLLVGAFGWTDFGDDFISFEGNDANDGDISAIGGVTLVFDLEVTQNAPEPGALALLSLALAGMGFARRRMAR